MQDPLALKNVFADNLNGAGRDLRDGTDYSAVVAGECAGSC